MSKGHRRVFLRVYSELYILVYSCVNQYENLGSWCCWLSRLGGISYLDFGPISGSVCATLRLFCEAISHKLAQKGVILLIKLPFPVHVRQVNPWACALASVVGQDLWLAPVLPPHTPWQEFIWYASSLTPGVCAWLLWAPQPDRSWHRCSWLFFGSRLTFGLVSGLIWFDRTYVLLLLNYQISHDKSSFWEYPRLFFSSNLLTCVLALAFPGRVYGGWPTRKSRS